eukprot:1157540-Pelagomonas_calceolata.AAC.11
MWVGVREEQGGNVGECWERCGAQLESKRGMRDGSSGLACRCDAVALACMHNAHLQQQVHCRNKHSVQLAVAMLVHDGEIPVYEGVQSMKCKF